MPTLGQPYQTNGWVAHVGPTWCERWHANHVPTLDQRLVADRGINRCNIFVVHAAVLSIKTSFNVFGKNTFIIIGLNTFLSEFIDV